MALEQTDHPGRGSNMILVTGATSKVGSELVRLLRRRGASVRALVHTARDIDWPGVDVASADLTDPQTLDDALEGVESIYLISPPAPRERHLQMERNLIDAAARAGVRRVVKQSVLDADPERPVGIMRSHHACEQYLRASGHPFTILRPNSFMQDLLLFARSIRTERAFRAPAEGVELSMIDARDVAATAVVVLSRAGHEGKTYELTGPQALGFEQVADVLSRVLGESVSYIPVSYEDARASLRAMGTPEFVVEEAIAHFDFWRTGAGARVTGTVGKLTGREPHSLADFAVDYFRAHPSSGRSQSQPRPASRRPAVDLDAPPRLDPSRRI
jgi:uncharacterized protein YbjT (DUF2867 family)